MRGVAGVISQTLDAPATGPAPRDHPGRYSACLRPDDRLAQYQAAMQYFGADGLGSVRQIYDASAMVVGSARYDPYGNVMAQSGAASVFAFAGEQQDATGLTYLRARYYSSYLNQWIQPDPIIPNYAKPQSLNRYTYVLHNPVRYTDPSGLIEQGEAADADNIVRALQPYGITIVKDWGLKTIIPTYVAPEVAPCDVWSKGNWKLTDLQTMQMALQKYITAPAFFGTPIKFSGAIGGHASILRVTGSNAPFSPPGGWPADIVMPDGTFGNGIDYAIGSIVHEFGHVWDYRTNRKLSYDMMLALGTYSCATPGGCKWNPYANPEVPAGAVPGCTVSDIQQNQNGCATDAKGNSTVPYGFTYGQSGPIFVGPGMEDWADSFASVIYPAFQTSGGRTNVQTGGIRDNYVRARINNPP